MQQQLDHPRVPTGSVVMLEGRRVPYTVRHSRRARYLSLRINLGTGLVAVLPPGFRRRDLPRVFKNKSKWIVRALNHYEGLLRQAGSDIPRGRLMLLGKPYRGAIENAPAGARRSCVEIRGNCIRVRLVARDRRRGRRVLEGWYRQRARRVIESFVARLSRRLGRRVGRIFIRDQKSKWGACSSRGNLSFNWRLIMAPPSVIRYVVVHEICHLAEFNHTRRFWSLVSRECPDYARQRDWLKTRGPLLGMLPEPMVALSPMAAEDLSSNVVT